MSKIKTCGKRRGGRFGGNLPPGGARMGERMAPHLTEVRPLFYLRFSGIVPLLGKLSEKLDIFFLRHSGKKLLAVLGQSTLEDKDVC
ncbi:MAG TPA: hypothetical protein VIB80_03490 [Aquiluna sp.]